jgi:hypothetical protein
MIQSIEAHIIFNGRKNPPTWFHPKVTLIPAKPNPVALLTCQSISGSDYFGQVYFSLSHDLGRTWSTPEEIPSLGRQNLKDGLQEGVCDVVPEFHPPTGTVLAVGHNVYYQDGKLTLPDRMRFPVYVVRDARGNWSDRWKLAWDDPRASAMHTSGCSQRILLPDGKLIFPLSFSVLERPDRSVGSALCGFDGSYLHLLKFGNTLSLPVKRGLLEPSLAFYDNRYWMTIRAEDDYGYLSTSADGLHWEIQRPWTWENGAALTLSTTQQHWLIHSEGLFLVYTRKTEQNVNVLRWRAPLFVAQVDTHKKCLLRETERVVLPLLGDGVNDPKNVALMGNFHIVNATEHESWVTVGENYPANDWKGDTLLARIRWARPNQRI